MQKLEKLFERLERFVDGLESIAESMGQILAQRHARLQEEVSNISDVQTPYKGGVFWITTGLQKDARTPPLLRF